MLLSGIRKIMIADVRPEIRDRAVLGTIKAGVIFRDEYA
jgi:hypothetical protein